MIFHVSTSFCGRDTGDVCYDVASLNLARLGFPGVQENINFVPGIQQSISSSVLHFLMIQAPSTHTPYHKGQQFSAVI